MQSVSEWRQLIHITANTDGSFIAKAHDLSCTAATREEALAQLQQLLQEQFASGELIVVNVPLVQEPTRRAHAGHAKDDADFDQYLEEIRRYREQMDQQSCSNTSSTPTT